MKLTFEGQSIHEIVDQMKHVIAAYPGRPNTGPATNLGMGIGTPQVSKPQGPGPEVAHAGKPKEVIHVDKSGDKPAKRTRTPKQLENDERLRERALAKIAAKKAARGASDTKAAPAPMPTPPPPASAESLGLEPDEVVRIRQKTITDLQEAYANGHQQEVFELLSRFGNGAKSFRELPPESFVPIREAIDNGALT